MAAESGWAYSVTNWGYVNVSGFALKQDSEGSTNASKHDAGKVNKRTAGNGLGLNARG